MRVKNETRERILADKAALATGIVERMRGLLGKDEFAPGAALIIDPCTSIHTFFMKFSIDVLFIDNDGSIVSIYESLPPWRLTRVYFRARSVVEMPGGTLHGTGTQVGDRLLFEELS